MSDRYRIAFIKKTHQIEAKQKLNNTHSLLQSFQEMPEGIKLSSFSVRKDSLDIRLRNIINASPKFCLLTENKELAIAKTLKPQTITNYLLEQVNILENNLNEIDSNAINYKIIFDFKEKVKETLNDIQNINLNDYIIIIGIE